MSVGQQNLVPAPADSVLPDSSAGIGELTQAVDRITEIRSSSDVWQLAGEFQTELLAFALDLVVAGVVLAVFVGVWLLVAAAVRPVFERARLEEDVAGLLLAITKYTILGLGLIVALAQLGFDVTGLLAGLGVAGLALGFAAKDTLANFIAGITILWDRPFRVGDRVEVDNEFGQVKQITLRSTRIHTQQNQVVIIPNQNVVNNKVVNHTKQASLRLDVTFGIAYKEDIDAAREAVLAVLEDDERVRRRPEPEVVVKEMADSAIVMQLRAWLENPHQEIPLGFEYTEAVKKALDRAGITIPFPHLSLYVEDVPEGATPREGERRGGTSDTAREPTRSGDAGPDGEPESDA